MANIKKIACASFAAILLFGCTACGSIPTFGPSVTLTVLAPQKSLEKGGWILAMEDAFQKENPGVTFKNTAINHLKDPYNPEGKKQIKISNDIFLFPSHKLNDLIRDKVIGKLSQDVADQVKKHNPAVLTNSVTGKDGKMYAVPYTSDALFMYYNKSKLSKNDVKDLTSMIQKQKVEFNVTNARFLSTFYLDSCITFKMKKGMDTRYGNEFTENCYPITSYLARLTKHPNYVNSVGDIPLEDFKSGKVAAYFSGIWDAEEVKKALGKNYAATTLPEVTTELPRTSEDEPAPLYTDVIKYQMKDTSFSEAIGYNAKSKNKKLAAKFAAFLGSTESQKKAYKLQKIVPTDITLKSMVANDPAAHAQMETIEKASLTVPLSSREMVYTSSMYSIGWDLHDKTLNESNLEQKVNDLNDSINRSFYYDDYYKK